MTFIVLKMVIVKFKKVSNTRYRCHTHYMSYVVQLFLWAYVTWGKARLHAHRQQQKKGAWYLQTKCRLQRKRKEMENFLVFLLFFSAMCFLRMYIICSSWFHVLKYMYRQYILYTVRYIQSHAIGHSIK